jgi:hypothetical protein
VRRPELDSPALRAVVANVVPVVGVLAFGWPVASLVAVYALERLSAVLVTVAKVLRADGEEDFTAVDDPFPRFLRPFGFDDGPTEETGPRWAITVASTTVGLAVLAGLEFGLLWILADRALGDGGRLLDPVVLAVAVPGLVAGHVAEYRWFVRNGEHERIGPVTTAKRDQMYRMSFLALAFVSPLLVVSATGLVDLLVQNRAPTPAYTTFLYFVVFAGFKTAADAAQAEYAESPRRDDRQHPDAPSTRYG